MQEIETLNTMVLSASMDSNNSLYNQKYICAAKRQESEVFKLLAFINKASN